MESQHIVLAFLFKKPDVELARKSGFLNKKVFRSQIEAAFHLDYGAHSGYLIQSYWILHPVTLTPKKQVKNPPFISHPTPSP